MKLIGITFLFTIIANCSFAQENVEEKHWKFLIEPYIMFPSMSGETGIRNLPSVDVDADAGDIFSKLQFGAMLYMEAQNDNWAITSDLLYMNLNQEATPTTVINSGEATAKQLGYELAGLYRIAPFWESGLALRLNSISSELDIIRNTVNGTELLSGSLSKTWIDPVIVTRLTADIDDKWIFVFRGDFGGFGIGSAFTWQVQGYAGYRFSKLFQTTIGYRIIGIDYDKGTGEDRFRYDMNTFGPNIRFGFNL
ncbi:MAG TPA: hypothetical protein PLJ60_20825 [Chryseolinea sp.]|nr:hypothetical protein [Chryseolinea sp.]HPM32789.1 hypothetical protein [Chryseolinea sp.]